MRRALVLLSLLSACGSQKVVISMLAENNSGQTGTATLEERRDGLHVTVVVRQIDGVEGQDVHFHTGQCGEISAKRLSLVLPEDERTELALAQVSPRADGGTVSENILKVKLADVTDGGWVINVHDPRDRALYTSCGNIR
jgi:CHRD domain